jgi:hypothetical protein
LPWLFTRRERDHDSRRAVIRDVRCAGPSCAALDHASALLLLLVRDCKINKGMLVRVGVPSIVRMLQQHADPRVSPTTVQALSGVVTLLAMSKTMLDLVQQTGGLRLVLELLEYRPPEGRLEGDAVVRSRCCCHRFRLLRAFI